MQAKRIRRHRRVRAKVKGTALRPRLSVFRSNHYLWAQLIDDAAARTLVAAADRDIGRKGSKETGTQRAQRLGELIAKRAQEQNIRSVIFDRGGYRYHGLIRALAEGARKGGLQF